MRRFTMAGLMLAGLFATGCKEHIFQMSVHPFLATNQALAQVAGRWLAEGDDDGGLEFVRGGENEWQVRLFDSKDSREGGEAAFASRVRFGRVNGALYWDMTTARASAMGDVDLEHELALHSVAKVELHDDTLAFALLKPEWLSAALADGRVDLPHFREGAAADDGVILTASTAELERFLELYGDDPQAFGDPAVYHRAP